MNEQKDNFIMMPTVDFCFKELMQNPKVRKGFIAALLHVEPEMIGETILMPTILRRESEQDKLGILDVRVLMQDGTQFDMEMQVTYFEYWDRRVLFYLSKMFADQLQKGEPYEKLQKCIHVSILNFNCFPDEECYRVINFCDKETGKIYTDLMEIQILELRKLPKEVRSGEDIIAWMRFFGGKSREEFELMAKENEYLNEAYDTLKRISADEQKRLEYEAREKALKDYNSQMGSALRRGEKIGQERGEKIGQERGEKIGQERGEKIGQERGEKIGQERGEKRAKQVFKLHLQGKTIEEIAKICGIEAEKVREILE